MIPKWKRGDLVDRLGNHMFAEAIYQRMVGDVEQIVERVYRRGDEQNAYYRPLYRLLEVRDGQAERVPTPGADTMREVRTIADRRAHRILRGRPVERASATAR